MENDSLDQAYYTQQRLLDGGALVFCSAVVVQLVQIPPPQLTTDLRLALWAAAVAIPPLAGVLSIYVSHERVKVRHGTHYVRGLGFVGEMATFICAAAIFQHFSGAVAIMFFALSVIVVWCTVRDGTYHRMINPPTGYPGSTHESGETHMEENYKKHLRFDALMMLPLVVMLLGGWLLVRFLAQRYL